MPLHALALIPFVEEVIEKSFQFKILSSAVMNTISQKLPTSWITLKFYLINNRIIKANILLIGKLPQGLVFSE